MRNNRIKGRTPGAGMLRAWITLSFSLFLFVHAMAQSEGGLLLTADVDKKINKKLSMDIEGTFRTRNDFKTVDRWSGALGVSYKLTKWLKASAGYTLLYDNYREKISYHRTSDGTVTGYNNWRPSYWGTRHRVNAALTVDHKVWGDLRLSLRERWQYTYRHEATPDRWDFDNAQWEKKVRGGKGKNQLRSRLQMEYDKKNAIFKPYAYIELYNKWSIEKVRYTVGTDIKLTKQHSFDVFYRFQDARNVDDDDYTPDMHYIGIGYKFKL